MRSGARSIAEKPKGGLVDLIPRQPGVTWASHPHHHDAARKPPVTRPPALITMNLRSGTPQLEFHVDARIRRLDERRWP